MCRSNSNNRRWPPRALFVVLTVVAALSGPGTARALDPVVTVSGTAELGLAPDGAKVRAGVITHGKTARESTDANSRAMNAVLAALKKDGIAEHDIRTARISVAPMRAPGRGPDTPITGFQTSNQVTVSLRDVGKVPALLDRMIEAGANDISGIDFTISDPSQALDRIRAAAIADARRKAEIYATAAGGKLDRALVITETERGPVSFQRSGLTLRAAPVPIAPGEEILRVSVTVTFALLP